MRSTSSRWIPEDHPLRAVKQRADEVLGSIRKEFDGAYSRMGRPSIPPEMLLKALLLQALHSIRSERQLVEQMKMNLLYRWFIDLSLDAPVWDPTSFTKNRERFEQHGLLRAFFDRVVESAYVEEWASSDHFTVDGTMIESYASMKSLRPQGSEAARVSDGSDDDDQGNPTVNFRGEKRSNRTHRSLTDPEARLARKSKGVGSQLAHAAHVLMENRNGLVVDVSVSEANGSAERQEALTRPIRSHGSSNCRDRGLRSSELDHPHPPVRARLASSLTDDPLKLSSLACRQPNAHATIILHSLLCTITYGV